MRTALSLVFSLLFFLSVSLLTPLFAASIVPGRSIGRIHLGTSRDAVFKAIGKPAQTTIRKSGYRVDEWFSKTLHRSNKIVGTRRKNFLRVTYKRNRVVQVEVTSPHFSTRNGVSTRYEKIYPVFEKLYKPYKSVILDMGGLVHYYDDRRNGIAFSVYTPSGPTSFLNSVIIHRLNTSVIYPNDEKPHGHPTSDYSRVDVRNFDDG
jgi:hypothetical protein